MGSKLPKPYKIKVVNLTDFPNTGEIYDCDLKLTVGEGISLYTKEETISEIKRHIRPPGSFFGDFWQVVEMIERLPNDVYIRW